MRKLAGFITALPRCSLRVLSLPLLVAFVAELPSRKDFRGDLVSRETAAMGMVCPRTGQFFAIETSHSDVETFQAFLDEAAKMIDFQRTKNILILDNATWHHRKTLRWNGWQPKYLPPYSPDLNPIERIWLVMKANWFNNYVCKNVDQLIDRLDKAILDLIDNPIKTQKTASIGTLI